MRLTIRGILVVAGLLSVTYLVVTTGATQIVNAIVTLSWRLAAVLLVFAVITTVLDTLAWRLAFDRIPSFRRLLWVRLAGEAVNTTTASVGGEAVKVYLLQPEIPAIEASAAMVVGKTGITIAQVAFLGVGVTAAALLLPLPPPVLGAAAAALVLEIIAVTGFVLIQRDGAVRRVVSLLRRWSWHTVADRVQGLVALDDSLAAFYRRRPGRFTALIALHLLAWVIGSVEVYLILRWLGFAISWPTALFIDAAGSAVSFLAFSVPARLGVLEGGYMAVFAALGLASGGGLSLALVRRLRLIVWSLLGVAVLLVHRATAARRADAIMARSAAVPGLVTVPRS